MSISEPFIDGVSPQPRRRWAWTIFGVLFVVVAIVALLAAVHNVSSDIPNLSAQVAKQSNPIIWAAADASYGTVAAAVTDPEIIMEHDTGERGAHDSPLAPAHTSHRTYSLHPISVLSSSAYPTVAASSELVSDSGESQSVTLRVAASAQKAATGGDSSALSVDLPRVRKFALALDPELMNNAAPGGRAEESTRRWEGDGWKESVARCRGIRI